MIRSGRNLAPLIISAALIVAFLTFGGAQFHRSRAARVTAMSTLSKTFENEPTTTQFQQPAAPETIGPIDSHVIAGGGGTSNGGSFRLDGTIGEVSASKPMSGGSMILSGGIWNALDTTSVATPTPTPTPSPTPTPTPTSVVQFSASNYNVIEDCTAVTVTVNRIGDTSGAASVNYNTSDVTATERKDYITALGKLKFTAGETSKTFVVLINEDSFVEGPETLSLILSNPSGTALGAPTIATISIADDASEGASNVIDDPQSFVCQHYHDFLNRQPDPSGLAFWTNEISSCGANQACIEIKRINVSAAFYLSIEFQETGYLVERLYKTAYADANAISTLGGSHQTPVPTVRFSEFLLDTQQIGLGVVVGQGDWQQQLENNKQSFIVEFVQRSRFSNALPLSLTPQQYVDQLNTNAGNPLSPAERSNAISLFGGAANTNNLTVRAQVLRQVAEDADLHNAEFSRAFVLMQFFGYLRRNPNDPQDTDYTGYDFWLTKLNQFNGNFVDAEMVKAFITSIEYRNRFGVN